MRRYLPALLTIGAILAWLFVGALKALPVLAKLTSFALHTQDEVENAAGSDYTHFPGVTLPAAPEVIVDDAVIVAIEDAFEKNRLTQTLEQDDYRQWLMLFQNKQSDALETIAETLRNTRPRYPNGEEKLYQFYYIVSGLGLYPQLNEGVDFNTQVVAWHRANKPAYTAAILIATRGNETAWSARGYAFAEDTPADQLAQFTQLKTYSREWLDRIATRGAQADPMFYLAVMDTNFSTELITESDHETFLEGVRRYPDFLPLYRPMAGQCMSRWFGAPDDLKYFAAWAEAQHPDSIAPNVIYAVIAQTAVSSKHDPPKTFQEHGLSWPHIKAGYVANIKQGHFTPLALNWFFRLAYAYEDKPTAAVLTSLMSAHYQAKAWNSDAEFQQALQWAKH